MSDDRSHVRNLKRVISYLRKNLASLREAGVDEEFLAAYKEIIENSPNVEGRLASISVSKEDKVDLFGKMDINAMSLSDVEAMVSNPMASRSILEKVATTYFGVPKGSVKSYRNKETLLIKIRSLIDGRKAHNSIERLASKEN